MSRVQKFFISMFPAQAESMEADSRAWFLKCPKCNFEQSIWEMGGIRWKAKGNSRNYLKCQNCKKRSWHQMYKKENENRL